MKKKTFFLSLVCFIACFYAQLNPSAGGMIHWFAIPSLLSLVPMIYMVMGFLNFLPAKEKWEIRVYYAGYRRLWRSGIITLVFLCIWTGMEVVYLILNPKQILNELLYLAALLIGTAALAVQIRLMKKHPAVVVEAAKIE